jgi:plasmid stability protein
MRTTLTLDDDVAAKLRAESRRTGRSFRDVVNEALRHGLATRRSGAASRQFRVETRDLGGLRPGLSLDSIANLLETIEGPLHR